MEELLMISAVTCVAIWVWRISMNYDRSIIDKFSDDVKRVENDLPLLTSKDQETILENFWHRWEKYIERPHLDEIWSRFQDKHIKTILHEQKNN